MIKPIGNLLLVTKIEEGEKTTKTGLVLTSMHNDSPLTKGTIVDMGDGEANYKGDIISITGLDIGDTVMYPTHSGTEIEDEDGTKYLLINCKNIMAVLTK